MENCEVSRTDPKLDFYRLALDTLSVQDSLT